MFKKRRNDDFNWTGKYIKEYNQMISYYEQLLEEKENMIKVLQEEINRFKSCGALKSRTKQITDEDIKKIKMLKEKGESYSYISNETGWSKATISRVINNKY